MNTKHTPGPWVVGQDDRNGQAIVRGEHIEIATCWHHSVGAIEKEMRANARLIAAAPELLEALVTAKWMLERDHIDPRKMAVIDKCGAAIAKADEENQEPTP